MAIQVFGQGAVQSAYPSYLAVDITLNSLTLVWADSYVDVPYTDPNTGIHYQALAATMDVTTAALNANTITLPNATETSIGQTFIIGNIGLSNFSLNKSNDDPLQIVATGIRYWVTLTDNSTAEGTWTVITLGAGTSQASAIALAGNGLVAILDKLNTNVPVVSVNAPPVIDTTFRAKLIVWTGGANTLPLPAIADVPAGYYVSFSNQGSAQITLQPTVTIPATTIGGQTSLAVQVRQSLTIISDGTNWQTLGFGQNQFAVDSSLTLDVSASVDVTLNNIQASSVIQNYVGALTANITVFFPPATSNWFISNETTGPHTLTVQLDGPLGTAYVIPQESKGIFYSNGTSMFVSPTALSLIGGTEALPALSFSDAPDTGVYNVTGNGMYVSYQGNDVAAFTRDGGGTIGVVAAIAPNSRALKLSSSDVNGIISYDNVTAISISDLGAITLPEGPLTLTGGQISVPAGPLTLSSSQVLFPEGTEGLPAISFSDDLNTGIYADVNQRVYVSFAGVTVAGFTTVAGGGGDYGSVQAFAPINGRILEVSASDLDALITYNNVDAININGTGVVTLPAAPLPIASGGTNAITAADALNNLMPTPAVVGDIVFFNGTEWILLPIGTPNQVLTVNLAGNAPEWV